MKVCRWCGTRNEDDASFCSECGKPFESAPGQQKAGKTILATAVPAQIPSQPTQQERQKAQSVKKTMLGIPSMGVKSPASQQRRPQPAPAQATKARAPSEKKPSADEKTFEAAKQSAGKTILGVSPIQPAAKKKETPPWEKAYRKVQAETPLIENAKTEIATTAQPSSPTEPPQEAQPPAPPTQQSSALRQRVEAPAEGIPAQRPQPATFARAMPPSMSYQRTSRIGRTTMLMMRKAAAVPRWLIVLIAVTIIGGISAGYIVKKFILEPRKPRVVKLSISQNPDYVSLDVEVELVNVDNISALKVGKIKDKTFKVENSKAVLNLPIGEVVGLGKNTVLATLIGKDGKEKGNLNIEFELNKFFQPQLQSLEEGKPPVFGLYFQTLPNAAVYIDGKPSPGEGPGKFLYQKMIKEVIDKAPPSTTDIWNVSFDYEVKLGNPPRSEKGSVTIGIPTVKLQVDRPADGAITTEDRIQCTGKTEEGAEVKINGKPVEVHMGGFSSFIPLPVIGDYEITVVAFSDRRGPRIKKLKIKRVDEQSLKKEIEAYRRGVEKLLTWEKLAPDPSAYIGKKIAYKGRIFNIKYEKGVMAFQMLVSSGCPEGARCTLVGTYRGESSVGQQSLVEVLGEVRGKSVLQTSTGAKFEAPRIEAEYIIPLKKIKRRKKRKR